MRLWLKEYRLLNNFSQRELAEKVGVCVSAINKYELGCRSPKVGIAKKIAKILNFDWTLFYQEKESA